MAGEDVRPPEEQAEEALREAYRKLAGELNETVVQCFGIPPAQFGPDTGWREGTCTGCGTELCLIKGPPSAGLCTYCDQLRIAPPMPPRPPAWRTGGPVIDIGHIPAWMYLLAIGLWVALALFLLH